jgi:phosphatidylethanolamine/phosphatidyl-N-methylethanolamine N-methyltransferase
MCKAGAPIPKNAGGGSGPPPTPFLAREKSLPASLRKTRYAPEYSGLAGRTPLRKRRLHAQTRTLTATNERLGLSPSASRPYSRQRQSRKGRRREKLRTWAVFFREFIRSPRDIAAVAPSSRQLGRAMVQGLDLSSARAIVEYGPGTGAFTRAVLEEIGPQWFGDTSKGRRQFIAIEHNAQMAQRLQEQHPEVTVVNASAADVVEVCRRHGVEPGHVDCIISGLGWTAFSDEQRTQMLEATVAVLKRGGRFHTFGYQTGLLIRGAWHFRSEVRRLFRHVRTGRIVWRNLPPAFVYQCVK